MVSQNDYFNTSIHLQSYYRRIQSIFVQHNKMTQSFQLCQSISPCLINDTAVVLDQQYIKHLPHSMRRTTNVLNINHFPSSGLDNHPQQTTTYNPHRTLIQRMFMVHQPKHPFYSIRRPTYLKYRDWIACYARYYGRAD